MQTIRAKTDASGAPDGAERAESGPGRDLRLALAGAATAVGGLGALLALIESDSPLRGPFTLFFLLAAPAAAIAAALDGVDPLGRAIVALAGAIAVDMLVAQALLALRLWSVRGGIVTVTALSALTLLLVLVRRLGGRTARRQGP
ncbi:hypothetical protein ACIHCM_20355 [Streptomyces sp. NPDC052023]|uniref:hypothetical protein n=1 Tax=Streptomyces sp. NPDC052023 TaxID=3365681 RepID=UPI0037D7FD41